MNNTHTKKTRNVSEASGSGPEADVSEVVIEEGMTEEGILTIVELL